MDFELNEDQQQIKRTIREFAEAELKPHVMEWDEAAHFPVELQPKFAELGIMGVLIPEEYGGAGMGYIEYATIIEELARVDPFDRSCHSRTQLAWGGTHLHRREAKPRSKSIWCRWRKVTALLRGV